VARERAKRAGLATAEIQISETETPLHRLETVYRRLTEQLSTATHRPSALRAVHRLVVYTLEEEVLDASEIGEDDTERPARRWTRWSNSGSPTWPADAGLRLPALRGYRRARLAGDAAAPKR